MVLMITRRSRYCKLDCLKALVTRAKLAEEFGVGSSTISDYEEQGQDIIVCKIHGTCNIATCIHFLAAF